MEEEVQTTIGAYRTATKQAVVWNPEVLIITSPRQAMYADYFHISPGRGATGDNIDLKGFTPEWYRKLGGDLETVKRSSP